MKILSIETSCDETALAALNISGDLANPKIEILGTELYSQIEKHRPYGGVFPSLAKREHTTNLIPLLSSLLKNLQQNQKEIIEINNTTKRELEELFIHEPGLANDFIEFISKTSKPEFDMLAVTEGPGLEPALWVGINFAIALSKIWQIPLMPVNHMVGHIVSVLNHTTKAGGNKINFPAISLLISGGHTQLISIKNWGNYKVIGSTKDDAVGEAFDKVARLLGLQYPGGPEISKLAEQARKENFPNSKFKLPSPMINTDDFDFSFSGLKTAVLYLTQKIQINGKLSEKNKKQIALEFENSVTNVLIKKTMKALDKTGSKTLIIGGGVIANQHIRESFERLLKNDFSLYLPEKELSTDNAIMIGISAFLKSFSVIAKIEPEIIADGNLSF